MNLNQKGKKLKKMNVGKSGLSVSALALGTWGMGGGTSWNNSDDSESVRVVHKALELGINLIDTAPVYGTGHSEEIVGHAITDHRDKYILSTKCSLHWRDESGIKQYTRDGKIVYRCFDPQSLQKDLEDSLKRLGTDYIDIYITHRQPDDTSKIPEIYRTLENFKKQGKIRAIGISNASPEILKKYLESGEVDLVQEKFSLLEAEAKKEYITVCEKNGVMFQGFSVLERGLLTGIIDMNYKVQEGEARSSIAWFNDDKRIPILKMLEGWKGFCETYRCSMANLVITATTQYSEQLNILFGASHLKSLEDTIKSLDVKICRDDLDKIIVDVAQTLKVCTGLQHEVSC
jgi:methylglyoxal reductase